VITAADIPPGGEGEIKVTLKTGHKRGAQTKTITVSSNDPNNPSARLQVKAFIELEFDFESYSVSMGTIPQDGTGSKTVYLLVKDTIKNKVTNLESNSEFVHAKVLEGAEQGDKYFKVPVEISVTPGLPPGNFRAVVTANPANNPERQSRLTVIGDIMGDVMVEPDKISFIIYDSPDRQNQTEQKVVIHYKPKDTPLQINEVKDQRNYLDLNLDTLSNGAGFELMARVKDEYVVGNNNYSGYIILKTSDPDESNVRIRYQIYHRK
jgi:hypothetical protein